KASLPRMDPPIDVGVVARARGIHDVFVPRHDVLDVARKDAARAEKIDLEDESVERVVLVEDILQRGVGDDPSVPEMIGADFDHGQRRGRAPLAITCSGPIVSCWLSKYMKFPDSTFTAPTEKRVLFSLSSEKSTSSSSVSRSGVLS